VFRKDFSVHPLVIITTKNSEISFNSFLKPLSTPIFNPIFCIQSS
jgi:hypothetical protein